MRKAFIPAELDDAGLDPVTFRIYCHIARRAGGRKCFAAAASIAEHCQVSRRTVYRALAELELHGLLVIKRRHGKSHWCSLKHTPCASNGIGPMTPEAHKGYTSKDIKEGTPGGTPVGGPGWFAGNELTAEEALERMSEAKKKPWQWK